MKPADRAKKVERAMRLAWDSLQSHLYYTHTAPRKSGQRNHEGMIFHKKAVKEYAELIHLLSELY